MVKLRYKKLKSGKYSIYLDIYSTDAKGQSNREYEFLKRYVSKEYKNLKNILPEDRENIEYGESVRKKREIELIGNINGLDANKKIKNTPLTDYLRNFTDRTGEKKTITIIQHLNTFQQGGIMLGGITTEWLEEFKKHLLSVVSPNSARSYLSNLKKHIETACVYEDKNKDPFSRFKMPVLKETQKIALGTTEIDKLISTPFPSHPHMRLAFLFSCFTGLRISDLYALEWSDIIEGLDSTGNKQYSLKLKPIKSKKTTGKTLYAPLNDAALHIFFEAQKDKSCSPKVFHNIPSERNAQGLIKIWAARAGIKKNLHFHIARHTFATISLTYGMDIYTVSQLLGHSKVQTTEIYAKIVDEKKRAEIKKLPELE